MTEFLKYHFYTSAYVDPNFWGLNRSVIVDSRNRIWTSFLAEDTDPVVFDLYVMYSEDGGNTWVESLHLIPVYYGQSPFGYSKIKSYYVNSLAIDSNDHLVLVYNEIDDQDTADDSSVESYKSVYYNGSWSAAQTIVSGTNLIGDGLSLAVDSSNTFHVIYTRSESDSQYSLKYSSKLIYTSSWSVPVTLDTEEDIKAGNIVPDSSDNLHVTYGRRISPEIEDWPYYIKCTSGSWGSPGAIEDYTSTGQHSLYISLIVDSNDNPNVVYARTNDALQNYATSFYYSLKTTSWSTPQLVRTNNGTGDTIWQPNLCIDRNNLLSVAYMNEDGFLKYTQRVSGSWTSPETLVSGGGSIVGLMWANYPEINGIKTNVPSLNFRATWDQNSYTEVWYGNFLTASKGFVQIL